MKTTEQSRNASNAKLMSNNVTLKSNYFTTNDIACFKEGTDYHLYRKFGAHVMKYGDVEGAYFAVWAPEARRVTVIGDFNGWDKAKHALFSRQDGSGIWEGFIAGVRPGNRYKFYIMSKHNGYQSDKADPFAFYSELSPNTASIVYDAQYRWRDQQWMSGRKNINFTHQPMSVYEVHLGSWRKNGVEEFQTYRQMAKELVKYVKNLGYTHVEFLPLMEHPFYGSWGYQALGYFAPTSRYGTPEDLMHLIDQFHRAGIGVILDWVVAHFPNDDHGIANFDGTQLFEQPNKHPDWNSCIFNFGRNEVNEFLISSAVYWMEKFHIDGLRVDAVASMLYLDYSKKDGEWEPNIYGGHENLEAISFIRHLNETVKKLYPEVQMIAEESTAWPNVTKPCSVGGLEFDMKWNMGWMHDTLNFFSRAPDVRGNYNNEIDFCLYYAFSENFVLSLSHDEVVHEKRSLIGKMPGEDSKKFSNLRAMFGYMYGHPGKKLLFMGGEFAQWKEWDHDGQLEWGLTRYDRHKQVQQLIRDLNVLYRNQPALHERDFTPDGFEWLDMGHDQKAVFSFLRKGSNPADTVLVVCNFMDMSNKNYTVGVPSGGVWAELLNTDDKLYGGEGMVHAQGLTANGEAWRVRGLGYHAASAAHHVKDYSLTIHLPALSVMFFKTQ